MANKDTPLKVAAEGLLAGMGGALALSAMVEMGRKMVAGGGEEQTPPEESEGISAGEALSEGPDAPPNIDRMTATFVQKVATGLFGVSLDADQQYLAGRAWHLTYGGFWGVVYALLQSSVGVPKLLLGPLYGLVVWALGPGWLVPKMKIMLPPAQQEKHITAMVMGVHAAYGAVVAVALSLLRRKD